MKVLTWSLKVENIELIPNQQYENADEQYRSAGKSLMAAIRALPSDHPLMEILGELPDYEALLRDEPLDEVWKSPPTPFGVSKRYLFRFDFVADMATGGFSTAQIIPLAQKLLQASKNLRSALISKEVQDFHRSTETKDDRSMRPGATFNYQQLSENAKSIEEKLEANRDRIENAGLTLADAHKEIFREVTKRYLARIHDQFAQLPPIPKLEKDVPEFQRRLEQIGKENRFEMAFTDSEFVDQIIENLIIRKRPSSY